MGVSSIRLFDKKTSLVVSRCSGALQGHPAQQSGGVHDWLIQTPVSTVQRGILVQPDADRLQQASWWRTCFEMRPPSPFVVPRTAAETSTLSPLGRR